MILRQEAAKRRLVIPNKQAATQPENHMPTSRRVVARKPGSVVALLGIVDTATTCVARLAAGLSGYNASHDIYLNSFLDWSPRDEQDNHPIQ